jgi:pyruvate dehydrogenase E1 component alpha subunit
LKQMDGEVKAQVVAAAEFATESPEPGLGELYTDVYA